MRNFYDTYDSYITYNHISEAASFEAASDIF